VHRRNEGLSAEASFVARCRLRYFLVRVIAGGGEVVARSAGSRRAGPALNAEPTAAADLHSSLRKGYARYHLVVAIVACSRRFLCPDERRSKARDLALTVSAAHAVASVIMSERATSRPEVAAWLDAGASAVGSAAALVSGLDAGVAQGIWPPSIAAPRTSAQWASAGTSVLGSDGVSRVARAALIASPYVVWPNARRWLKESGLFGETLASLLAFAGAGHLVIEDLRSTAQQIDARTRLVVGESETVAALEQDSLIRDQVIAETAERLRVIRRSLGVDRAVASREAGVEEARLRAWLEDESEAQLDSGQHDDAGPSYETSAGLERFLAVSESLLRATAAAQLLFEIATQRRPSSAKVLALLAGAHAAWACSQLLRADDPDRRRMVAVDLAFLSLAGALDVAETNRGWEAGWTHGFSQALSAATGAIDGDRPLAVLASIGTGSIGGLGAVAGGRGARTRSVLAAERAVYTGSLSWLTHWFTGLVRRQAEQLSKTTADLATLRASEAASAVRRNGQYLVHDGALQVLLWLQKPDMSAEQLDGWLEREIDRLGATSERASDIPRDLRSETDALIRGFGTIGLDAQVEWEGVPTDLPSEVVSCVIEICNEALANVMKHSSDRHPVVRIRGERRRLVLSVDNAVDDADGESTHHRGTGSAAMADRAGGVGGSVQLGRAGERFVLEAEIPLSRAGLTGAVSR
jgi:hypothetical protein